MKKFNKYIKKKIYTVPVKRIQNSNILTNYILKIKKFRHPFLPVIPCIDDTKLLDKIYPRKSCIRLTVHLIV